MNSKNHSERKSEHPQRLSLILRRTLNQRNISLPMKDSSVWNAWDKAVGPVISAQTRVDRLDRETLFVKVSSPAWMQQLQFMKQEILDRINETLGKKALKNLFFSAGEVPPNPSKGPEVFSLQTDRYPLKEREERLIESCTAPISDRELHDILKRAMTKNLIRRKMEEDLESH
jgi:hypothetical protein